MNRSYRAGLIILISLLLLSAYGTLFFTQEQYRASNPSAISPSLPSSMLNVIGHTYLSQIIAESLFIKTAVYYGGLTTEPDKTALNIMADHFVTMNQLHPKLLDTYYRTQATLAHRGEAFTTIANDVLANGRQARPEQVAIPFLEGFNYFYYLNEPLKAAEILRSASQIEGAPKWIEHLATMLMASGGNIRTGPIWLKGMLATAQEPVEQKRYETEIKIFENALEIELALERYASEHGEYPKSLSLLTPNYISALSPPGEGYKLEYAPPKLFLRKEIP